MASYTKLDKFNWKVVVSLGFDENGKRKRLIKQGFRTKKEAELFVTDTLDKNNKGYNNTLSSNILFKDFLLKWFNEYKVLNITINTKNDYISRMNTHIIPMLGKYKLTDINTAIMQDFYNNLVGEKGLKPVSAKKVIDITNGAFKYAKKLKLIYELPTDIERVKLDKPIIKYWSQSEIDYFIEQIKDDYFYTPFLICVLTGVRVGELCGLRWKSVDFEEGSITISEQVIHDRVNKQLILSEILKTSNSNRTITIPNILLDHLKALKKFRNANDNDFVVLNRQGQMCTPRNISMEFTKKVARFKLTPEEMEDKHPNRNLSKYRQLKQISIHELRHTHATLLIFNGENIKVVSDRLGHKDISITLNTYTHVMDDMKHNTAKLLDSLFNKGTK